MRVKKLNHISHEIISFQLFFRCHQSANETVNVIFKHCNNQNLARKQRFDMDMYYKVSFTSETFTFKDLLLLISQNN